MSDRPMPGSTDRTLSNLLRRIATDIHFWIPLTVLIAGLVLLDKLS
jgi:hypothetical protein